MLIEDHDGGVMDREQFETCWHETIPRVLAYAWRHVGGDAAYDIVSATHLTAWRTWDDVPDHALPWLLSTAHGQIRNHLRSRRRQLRLVDRIELLGSTGLAHNAAYRAGLLAQRCPRGERGSADRTTAVRRNLR